MTPADATTYAFQIRDALHIPRRALDSMTVELAILIGELCETPEQAKTLTAAILAQSWGRFDLPEFRRRAERLAGRAPEPEAAPLDEFDPGGPFTRTEFEGLRSIARKHRLTIEHQGKQYADVFAAHAYAQAAAAALFAKLKTADRRALLDHCRAERQSAFAAYARVRSRDTDHFTGQHKAYAGPVEPLPADVEEWARHRLYLEIVGERPRLDTMPLPKWLEEPSTKAKIHAPRTI